MKSYFFDKEIEFQSTSLKPGLLKKTHKIIEDATASFISPYEVTLPSKNQKDTVIVTGSMLHIIVEHKGKGLRETATCLELMLNLLCQTLGSDFWSSKHNIYYEEYCLGVASIETRFRSSIFHLALFIEPNIPKKTATVKGLQDFDVNSKELSILLMQKYCAKIIEIEEYKKNV